MTESEMHVREGGRGSGRPKGTRSIHLPESRAARAGVALALMALCVEGWSRQTTVAHAAAVVALSYLTVWAWSLAAARSPDRRFLFRFVVVTGSLAFTAALLEVPAVLGWIDYRVVFRMPTGPARIYMSYVDDDELLFRDKPGTHLKGVSAKTSFDGNFEVLDAPERPFDVSYDERGFRNPPGTDRAEIAFLGDSFTEGSWTFHEDLWTTLVGRRLDRPVANFGTVGWGPRQELVALRRYALPVRPRVVVWQFFEGNDLGDLVQYDIIRSRLAEVRADDHCFEERSFAKNSVRALVRLAGPRLPSALPRSGLLPLADGSRERTYFENPGAVLDDVKAFDKFAGVLADADRECRAAGAKLLLVYVPEKFRVYRGLVEFAPDATPLQWRVSDLPERVRKLAADSEPLVEFLDLTPALRASAAAGRPPYFTDDPHWSAQGHAVAADAVADAIARLLTGH